MIDPRNLKKLDINPNDRVSKNALSELLASMKSEGFWYYRPVIITKDNVICDGHRRVACAIELGIKEIPAYIIKGDPHKIWADVNSGVRVIGSRALYQAAAAGLRHIPKTQSGSSLKNIIAKYGIDVVRYLAENGVSKSAIMYAERLSIYVGKENDTECVIKCLTWLVDHKYVNKVRIFIELKLGQDVIKKCIEENTELSL
jgi:hypothetical protein